MLPLVRFAALAEAITEAMPPGTVAAVTEAEVEVGTDNDDDDDDDDVDDDEGNDEAEDCMTTGDLIGPLPPLLLFWW